MTAESANPGRAEPRSLADGVSELGRLVFTGPLAIDLAAACLSAGRSRCVVLDAGLLRGEILRVAARRQQTILMTLASLGLLLAFAAQHVVDEVEEHLEEWCEQAGLSLQMASRAWSQDFKPLITVVDFDPALLSLEESRRIAMLVARDSDDVPTAVAALVLRAPLLGLDKDSLEAVYEVPLDYGRHHAYVQRLRANSEAELIAYVAGTTFQAAIVASLGLAAGVRALGARIGNLTLGALAAGLVLTAGLSDRVRGRWPEVQRFLAASGDAAAAFLLLHHERSLDYQLIGVVAFDLSDLPERTATERDRQRRAAMSRARDAARARLELMRRPVQPLAIGAASRMDAN